MTDGLRWSEDDLAKYLMKRRKPVLSHSEPVQTPSTPKPNKYGAKGGMVDGRYFRSGKEARRYEELRLLEKVGAIKDLECQPRYELIASNGEIVGHCTADFRYHDLRTGQSVTEDVKGGPATRTEAYKMRKRFAEACHGIKIIEV